MSKLKHPAMEVIQGEMYIFGEKLPRHPEFPWLFSATALHKSCEEAIKLRAKKDGKDPEKFYEAKRPWQWIKRNLINNEERIEHYANHTRTRIKKYGPNLGFGLTVTFVTVKIDEISDLDIVIQTKSGRYGGGSYLCQLAIVKYIETFSEKFRATVQNSFISMVNGEVETVTEEVEENAKKARGTKVRQENKELFYELVEACGRKKLIPLKAQQGINEGTLGMTGAKYKKLYGVPEPLNDNLTVAQVRVKNMSMIIATKDISDHAEDKISPEDGVKIGRLAALQSRVVLSGRLKDRILKEVALLEKEDKANEKRLTREFKAGKRPILPE
jgi:hypothetical protein